MPLRSQRPVNRSLHEKLVLAYAQEAARLRDLAVRRDDRPIKVAPVGRGRKSGAARTGRKARHHPAAFSTDRGDALVGRLITYNIQIFDALEGHASESSKRKRCEHNSDREGQITDHVALRHSIHLALRFPCSLRGAST